MQSFEETTTDSPRAMNGNAATLHYSCNAEACAGLLLETVPRIMRALRCAIAARGAKLTVPQFRTLHFVHSHTGASLSATAEFLGLTLPSTSKLVDQMVRRRLLARDDDVSDRRRMTLRLTGKGDALLKDAQNSVRRHLAGTLDRFGAPELAALQNALGLLQESFPPISSEGHFHEDERAPVAALRRVNNVA